MTRILSAFPSLLSNSMNRPWSIMITLSVFFVSLTIFVFKSGSPQVNSPSSFETYQSMQRSLQFIHSKPNASVYFSTEMVGFYELTDWRRFKESSYRNRREGDYGQVNQFTLNTKFINEKEGFNTILNRQIPLDRIVPDLRPGSCKYWHYLPDAMPSVSIIIAFTEEHDTILLRSIYSILLSTPRNLLSEIILVCDQESQNAAWELHSFIRLALQKNELNADNAALLKQFANMTPHMPLVFGEKVDDSKIRLLVTGKRVGLARSLNLGASNATGDVLVFLKSHVEVSPNWLLPLLAPILDDERTVVIPNVIGINAVNFMFDFKPYIHHKLQLFYWNWGLQTQATAKNWPEGIAKDRIEYTQTLPYQLDLVASSQFAISKKFFTQLGAFDLHYVILDEVNLDLSFKVHQCGGRVLKTHCSNVFALQKMDHINPMLHIFDEIYMENDFHFERQCFLKAMANMWIGAEKLSRFHTVHPSLTDEFCRNASNRYDDEHLRTASSCVAKPVENLFDRHHQFSITSDKLMMPFLRASTFLETIPQRNLYTGYLMNTAFSICLHLETENSDFVIQVETSYCREKPAASVFRLDAAGVLRFEHYCLVNSDKTNDRDEPYINGVNCFFELSAQMKGWHFTEQGQLRSSDGLCLTYRDSQGLLLAPCSKTADAAQSWQWI